MCFGDDFDFHSYGDPERNHAGDCNCAECVPIDIRRARPDGADGVSGDGVVGSKPDALLEQPHYTSLTPEPIDVIEGWGLGFRLGNAVKYIARAGRKPGQPAAKDLAKAIRYIQREINAIAGTKSWT